MANPCLYIEFGVKGCVFVCVRDTERKKGRETETERWRDRGKETERETEREREQATSWATYRAWMTASCQGSFRCMPLLEQLTCNCQYVHDQAGTRYIHEGTARMITF